MGMADNLKDIISRQKELLSELDAEYKALESSDLLTENKELKSDIDKLRTDYEHIANSAAELSVENTSLKNALYEQVYNEKVNIVNTTAQKLNIYFRSNADAETNRLTALENSIMARINGIKEKLEQSHITPDDEIYAKLDEASTMLDYKLTQARAEAERLSNAFSREERDELEALKNEPLSGEQIRAAAKKNNFERFVGLNVLNAIGIFLLIIGVITAARYTYLLLPDLLKGIMMFVLGGVMLGAGEIMNRKKPNVFSLGISAGGVGILYVALATSYFALQILTMYPAIIVCVLVTAGAFLLSHRYRSQTIAAFALIGGYLPMFSLGAGDAVVYGAMVYFVALNLLALLISFVRKWHVTAFIGLFLNIAGTLVICGNFSGAGGMPEKTFTILYVMFAFLIYTAIPITGTYRAGLRFRISDIVILAINTLSGSLIMYWVFNRFGLSDYNGLLAAAFAVIYLLLGSFIERKFSGKETYTRALFYLTGFAFVVLIVPMQFGVMWLSLGWLAEGTAFAVYGILKDAKRFKQAGFTICLLCLFAFFMFDYVWMDYLFAYKYLAITLGSVIILGAYMYKKLMTGSFVKGYKYCVIANIWLYSIYIISKLGDILYSAYFVETGYRIGYLTGAASAVLAFIIAFTAPRIKLLADFGTRVLSAILYIIGILWIFVLNSANSPVGYKYLSLTTPALGITITGTAILVALGLLSVFAVRDLMKIIVTGRKLGMEWYPLIISGYFVIILTQNLITQFGLSFSSAAISIIYVLTALAWIIFGFARRYSFIRRFGLGLAIMAVVKLFLIDLASLTQGYRIVSYFALGITLIAISFVYQYFNKRLELKEGLFVDAEKDN